MSGRFRNLALVLADMLCLVGVWAFSLWAYRAVGLGHYKFGFEFYLRLWPVPVAFVGLNALFRLYHGRFFSPAAPVSPVEELRRLVGSSALTHLGVIAALALAYQTTEHYSRAVILISGALTSVLAQPVRDLLRRILHRFDCTRIPVVILGDGETAKRVARTVENDGYLGFRAAEEANVAVVCRDAVSFAAELPVLSRRFAHIEFVPDGVVFPTFGTRPVSFDGISGLEVVNQRRMRLLRFEKLLLDKMFAGLAFVLLSPFFVLIPILVKMTSRGPVFYRQDRLGKNGRLIRVWKFRSMYADADERLAKILSSDPVRRAEWKSNFKLADDPRVTPFGRFLRRTSLDELPQLFNVFVGDMSLVGPRPIIEKEVAYYGSDYDIFASVKPGVTGLWQVSGRSDVDYVRRVALDMHYIRNWSPWMDLWILFRTVSAVLLMRGAR